ncbi:M16 family metallopeptidase [Calothrix sp. PCC 6303]|uniref:M16 family metallopeptidase n=1 Tax=Calothrix sp. PCC 6303 TaxID=1170562 RepID=UPI0002A04580|nr:pitrilysin family protein [Calothrix sp. PCC 6303]AFZ04346.1 processing peptidase [Calothrix sp. PCC 6303]
MSINKEFPASVCKLDNGLTFIHQQITATPVVVADIWVGAGSALESQPYFGMAHFLEHMIFKGTAKVAPGVFDRNIENRGGVSNAATSYDYAHYNLTTVSDHLGEILPQMLEMLLHPAIPDDEFNRERDVVIEEIRQAQDDPDWLGYQHLINNIYQHHPYGRSVLGTESELMQNSPAAMRNFHGKYYQPENMTAVVVGGISQASALEIVGETFCEFTSDCYGFLQPETTSKPIITGINRQEIAIPRLEQARLIMAWVCPGVEKLRAAYGMDLLSTLLAEGRTSRLVRDLREEQQLVQGICSNFSLQKESSLFTITAWLEPKNIETVEALICLHLEKLLSEGISQAELTRCQRLLCSDYAFSTETPNQIASLYGYYSTVAQPEIAVTYPQQILSYDVLELQKLANSYLSPEKYTVTVMK